ncbi:MAG: glycoside hydrolase family 38 C-terminal domain-containing protein, partial [Anaerolineales bacterium]
IQNGPFQATILLRLNLFVPEKFDFKHMYRSEKKIPLAIEHYLTLRKGQDYLEVETFVENTAQDHRLRILFPSGAKTDTYLADSAFDVVERAITLRADNHLYREMEVETKPQQSWTAVFDEQRGLAVISSGLLESAVRDLPDRTLALTLLRSTKKTVGTVGEPGGQEQGRLNFRYWILPIHGSPDRTRLCEMGQQVSNGLKFAQMQPEDVHIYTTDPILPPKASFLCLEGPAVITSLQWVNDGLEVRMFNPLMKTSQNMIRIKNWPEKVQKFQWVQPVNFESSPQGDRKSINQAVELEPKQILTVRLS